MSREIKYRAWDKTAKKMLDWDMLLTAKAQMSVFWEPEKYDIVLMQYTGLKDKNGTEIYEGDIVKVVFDDEESIHSVEYLAEKLDYPAFDLVPSLDVDSNCLSWAICANDYELEVIGNIYENGDLLK